MGSRATDPTDEVTAVVTEGRKVAERGVRDDAADARRALDETLGFVPLDAPGPPASRPAASSPTMTRRGPAATSRPDAPLVHRGAVLQRPRVHDTEHDLVAARPPPPPPDDTTAITRSASLDQPIASASTREHTRSEPAAGLVRASKPRMVAKPSPLEPRPLIRPAHRTRDAATESDKPVGRPIISPDARGLVPTERATEDAPLSMARTAAMRADTRPTDRVKPSVPNRAAPSPDEQAAHALPGIRDDGAPDVPHEDTLQGLTRSRLSTFSGRPVRVPTQPNPTPSQTPPALPEPLVQREEAPLASLIPEPMLAPAPASMPMPVPASTPARTSTLARALHHRAPVERSETSITQTAERPRISNLFARVSLLALLLLFQAVALPTANGAPWELLARPAEVTLQAMAALVLIGVIHLLRGYDHRKARYGVALGVVLLPFVFFALRHAAAGGAFDGQPAIDALITGSLPTPGALALVALVLIPAALFAHARGVARLSVWILAGTGFAAFLIAAFATSIGKLFTSMSDAPFLGDRLAAWLALPMLLALIASVAVLAIPRLRASANAAAFTVWAAALLPLVVLALFVAKSDQWMLVLEPLKLVSFVGAVTLYLAAAIAATMRPGGFAV